VLSDDEPVPRTGWSVRVAWSNGPGGRLATHLARHHGPNAVGALVAELSHHLDEATTIASMTGRYPHSGADTSVLDHLDPSDGDTPGTS
jgi:hypothetical protein